jgi:hypothetical protein
LGVIDIDEVQVTSNGLYTIETGQDGIVNLQLSGVSGNASLRVYDQSGREVVADSTLENGVLRVDFSSPVNVRYLVQSNFTGGNAELSMANVLTQIGSSLRINGTSDANDLGLDLRNGLKVDLGDIEYQFAVGAITELTIDQRGGADLLQIQGSSLAETVTLNSNNGNLASQAISIQWVGSERVSFDGHSGPDRVSAFDTDGNDTLNINPRRFVLDGSGYQFTVTNAERLFVNATSGGTDMAYMFDSAGDDFLTTRPQFTSLRGDGFFSFVTGFERVFAYANAGGNDSATLYDSSGNDLFNTGGDNASIVGNNYYAATRYFENVEAIASSGGNDRGSIYSNSSAQHFVGSDFVTFQQNQWSRTARGFDAVDSFVVQPNGVTVRQFSDSTIDSFGSESPIDVASIPSASSHSSTSDRHQSESFDTEGDYVVRETPVAMSWLDESEVDVAVLSRIDPLTFAMLDPDREAISLNRFFEEFGDES